MTDPPITPSPNHSITLVLVGEIVAPFGVRGQVKMRPLMDDPAALLKLPGVLLRWPDGAGGREETQRIASIRPHGEAYLLTLSGVPDRNAAETMHGVQIFIRHSELPALEEDAYYAGQLIGLNVVTESGRDFGKIEQIHFGPANDVYETPNALIPAVGEVIIEVDLPNGAMIVRDLPGLRKDE